MTTQNNERGIAIVIALFLMAILTALGTSLMFLSQTETYASMNYRMMSQARYAAEAGVQKASNFLLDPLQYIPPGNAGADPADPFAGYTTTVSPVTYGGNPVILSAISGASNYPSPAVKTAFGNAFTSGTNGTLTAGNAKLTYTASAKLISMQRFDSYGGGQQVVQTWEITATGGLGANHNATVEVVALVETPKVPASSFAAFATADTCGALDFDGDVTINSYDSSTPGLTGATMPTMDATGGNVGTNGNLEVGGDVDVDGNLYTPRTGVGTCTAGAVDALSGGVAHVHGSIVQLPSPIVYPPPPVPLPSPLLAVGPINSAVGGCASLGLTIPTNCAEDAVLNTITIDGHGATLSMPQVTLGSHTNIVLVAGHPATYNFNAIELNGGSSVGIKANDPTEGVLVNLVGKNPDNSLIPVPMDFVGGTFASVTNCPTCSNFDASMLQFLYAGPGELRLTGNSGAATTVYAPNANIVFSGTADLFGSVLGQHISNVGNADIHYDRRLMRDFYVVGHPMVGTFSWKRY